MNGVAGEQLLWVGHLGARGLESVVDLQSLVAPEYQYAADA